MISCKTIMTLSPDTIIVRKITTPAEMAHAFHIRSQVFIIGQGVPADIDIDGEDHACTHYIAYCDDKPAGTVRARPYQNGIKIERVAVLEEFRGKGIAKHLMKSVVENARAQQELPITVHAQSYIASMYDSLGFKQDGPEFLEADIPHCRMILTN